MLNNIIPIKIVIDFDVKGDFVNGILLYKKVEESGSMAAKTNSISIKNGVNIPIMNGLIQKAIQFAKKQEGINVGSK